VRHRIGGSPVTVPCASYVAQCENRTWRSLSVERSHATPPTTMPAPPPPPPPPSCPYPYAIMKRVIRCVLGLNLSPFTNSPSTVPPTSFNMPTSSHSSLADSSRSQPQPDGPFELGRGYTPLQVLETKILLQRRGLPLEVIDTILDFAEYWALVSTTAQYASERVAWSTRENSYLGYLLYLRTRPLPGEFRPEPATGDGAIEGVTTGRLIGREPPAPPVIDTCSVL